MILGGLAVRIGHGVNPARAGMIPIIRGEDIEDVGKPRASGDDPDGTVIGCDGLT